MKKLSTYLPSLIISVMLVFMIFAGTSAIFADLNLTEKKCISLVNDKRLEETIYSELEKYYKERYNSTGIPAEVYMSAIDADYIKSVEQCHINALFGMLDSDTELNYEIPTNPALEHSIESFFNDYAESISYEKDEAYEKKLESTKNAAYNTIQSYCDLYKVSALNEHGVLKKLSAVYSRRILLTLAILVAVLILVALLIIINRKKKMTALYWCGISAIISGALTVIPCIYLLAANYYDSFSIKQPQVFKAFTGAMYKLTEAMTAVQISIIVIGIFMIVIYGVLHEKNKALEANLPEIDKK